MVRIVVEAVVGDSRLMQSNEFPAVHCEVPGLLDHMREQCYQQMFRNVPEGTDIKVTVEEFTYEFEDDDTEGETE